MRACTCMCLHACMYVCAHTRCVCSAPRPRQHYKASWNQTATILSFRIDDSKRQSAEQTTSARFGKRVHFVHKVAKGSALLSHPYIHPHTHPHTHPHAHPHTRTRTHTHARSCVLTCAHIHSHIHTHTVLQIHPPGVYACANSCACMMQSLTLGCLPFSTVLRVCVCT